MMVMSWSEVKKIIEINSIRYVSGCKGKPFVIIGVVIKVLSTKSSCSYLEYLS